MKVMLKKGDEVKIITGDDKGKKSKILKVFYKKNKLLVEGCKLVKKSIKKSKSNPKGGFENKEMPIDISNVRKVEE